MFKKVLLPAIYLMNRLPFKLKLIFSISILFLLLISPSKTTYDNIISENENYKGRMLAVTYLSKIHTIIKNIQLHRGLINAYLNGDKKLKNKIISVEETLDKNFKEFIVFDKKNLDFLNHNKYFVDSFSKLNTLKLKNLNKNMKPEKIFSIHTETVDKLLKSFSQLSAHTGFSNTTDERLKYIANLLDTRLPTLEDSIGRLRGLSTGIFVKQFISREERNELLSIYTIIKSIKNTLKDNQSLTSLDNYAYIQTAFNISQNMIDELLAIVDKNIFYTDNIKYNSQKFFNQSTKTLKQISNLYTILLESYKNIVHEHYQKNQKKIYVMIGSFCITLLVALYIFGAFYISVEDNLKHLKLASDMITKGKTDIKLKVNTKDEIGEALLAFNKMSQKLGENLTFLDGYKLAIDESSIVSKTDKRGFITYVNKKFCEISGYSEKELLGEPHNIVRHPDMPKETFKQMWHTIKKEKKIWHGIVKNRKKDGDYYIVDATIIPILNSKGDIHEYIAVRHDVTEIEKNKERMKLDQLTKLPNRTTFLEDVKKCKKPTIVMFDIDDFNSLNDFYGSEMGDKVLVFLASQLKKIVFDINSKLYKLDSDRFAILVDNNSINRLNYKDSITNIINIIEKESINCNDNSCVSISLRAGVVFGEDIENYSSLINYANLATKYAKRNNSKVMKYIEELDKIKNYQSNMEWINKIKSAIEDDRIVTYFQPIMENSSGAITKYEILVRLIEEDGKVISPYFFLDIAKKAKLYSKITKIVINKAFKMFKDKPKYEFSLNLSFEDISNKETSRYIIEKLQDFPHPQKVVFEILESEDIKDYTIVDNFISKVKSFGVKIAIDDFGSGYANFEHILNLKADFIKIDGSLIKDITTNKNSLLITEAIIAFSKKIGVKTIVEFVHNEDVQNQVMELWADYSQGYFIGEPKAELVKSVFLEEKESESVT